jgi:hypothetical protein
MGAVLEEVVVPYVIAVLGAEPVAGAVVRPETAALELPVGHLQLIGAQIRLTRLSLTSQPARRSSSAILR